MSDDDKKKRRQPGESLNWLPDFDPAPGQPTPPQPVAQPPQDTSPRGDTSPGTAALELDEGEEDDDDDDMLKTHDLTPLGVQAFYDHDTHRVIALARQSDRYWSKRLRARLELARRTLPEKGSRERTDAHDVICELCDIIEELTTRFGY